jgi:hypothetical protein
LESGIKIFPVSRNLTSIDDEKIETIYRVARATYLLSGDRTKIPYLNLLTDVWEEMPEYRDRVAKDSTVGLCCARGSQIKAFDIWLHPNFIDNAEGPEITFMHELAHGFTGLDYGHQLYWRRFFTRLVYHYSVNVLGVRTDKQIVNAMDSLTKRYRKGVHFSEVPTSVKWANIESERFKDMYSRLVSRET